MFVMFVDPGTDGLETVDGTTDVVGAVATDADAMSSEDGAFIRISLIEAPPTCEILISWVGLRRFVSSRGAHAKLIFGSNRFASKERFVTERGLFTATPTIGDGRALTIEFSFLFKAGGNPGRLTD